MKNTFKLTGINFTIEGNPIAIDNIELTSEMTAQELATSGGLINGLLKELKPLIEEATKPVPAPQIQQNNNYNNQKKEKATYIKPDAPESVEMRVNRLILSKPDSVQNIGFRKWEFKDLDNKCSVTFELDMTDSFNISIKGNGTMIWIHVYGSNTKISGLDFGSLPLFLDQAGFPADVKAFIMKAIEI